MTPALANPTSNEPCRSPKGWHSNVAVALFVAFRSVPPIKIPAPLVPNVNIVTQILVSERSWTERAVLFRWNNVESRNNGSSWTLGERWICVCLLNHSLNFAWPASFPSIFLTYCIRFSPQTECCRSSSVACALLVPLEWKQFLDYMTFSWQEMFFLRLWASLFFSEKDRFQTSSWLQTPFPYFLCSSVIFAFTPVFAFLFWLFFPGGERTVLK